MSETGRGAVLSCEEARVLLDARPDLDAARARLAEHMGVCVTCSAYQEAQAVLDTQLADMLVIEPPSWLADSILAQVSPEQRMSWWTQPSMSLALQWTFYILLSGGLLLGLLLPFESAFTWGRVMLDIPSQLGVALEVLIAVIGLVPMDPIVAVFDGSSWLYECVALALVFWWLRQGSTEPRPRAQS